MGERLASLTFQEGSVCLSQPVKGNLEKRGITAFALYFVCVWGCQCVSTGAGANEAIYKVSGVCACAIYCAEVLTRVGGAVVLYIWVLST